MSTSPKIKDDFVELVEKSREKKSSQTIYNASIEHAEVLLKNLFKVAIDNKKDVKIVSGNLNDDFYKKLVDDARKAFEKGCKVSLIVLNQKVDLKDNAFANAVKNNASGEVLQQTKSTTCFLPHFMLVGKDAFRIEKDHEQTKAIASFNDQEIGTVLYESFEELKSKITH